MTYAIRSHMAAEGVDAALPTLYRNHALANNAIGVALLAAAGEAVLKLLDKQRGDRR